MEAFDVAIDDVSAVIPTRGDRDLSEVIESLPFKDVVVWDNADRKRDLGVYGRYEAISEAKRQTIYVQDDDCLFPEDRWDDLLAAYEPGKIVCNMPVSRWADYPDSGLVGWGALFHRLLPERAFRRFASVRTPIQPSEVFLTECDVIFTTLTPVVKIDLGFSHLPWAEGPDRLFRRANHASDRQLVLDMARKVRDLEAQAVSDILTAR